MKDDLYDQEEKFSLVEPGDPGSDKKYKTTNLGSIGVKKKAAKKEGDPIPKDPRKP